MKRLLAILLFSAAVCAQPADRPTAPVQAPRATIDLYRIISAQRDTTYVDTSLTIQSDYRFNYLHRDNFGLMPFPNEGQPYNVLQFSLNKFTAYPHSGRKAKHFKYFTADDINYYSVATPFTELYYRSVMQQGQNLDAFVTMNTSENLNLSIAYNGLRSLGKYINQLSSVGNLRVTASYHTDNRRYMARVHVATQDILNDENGGLTNVADFESGDTQFNNRARLEVFHRDAESFLLGKRIHLDHQFRVLKHLPLTIEHTIEHEYKFFEYRQPTIASQVTDASGGTTSVLRYGEAFVTSDLRDRSRYNHLINRVSAVYETGTIGTFTFFAEDFRYNYFYDRNLLLDSGFIPGLLKESLQGLGGRYRMSRGKFSVNGAITTGVAGRHYASVEGSVLYRIDSLSVLRAGVSSISKIPDLTFSLHQSRFSAFNWFNEFRNEKITSLFLAAQTRWLNAEVTAYSLTDRLYFIDSDPGIRQIVTPQQYNKTIGYVSVKLAREFRFRKWALDNTVLFQSVTQDDPVLNVPELTHRHTLYFSDYFFKRALYIQTGVTLNMFTAYLMDDYNPVLGEFFVQRQREIGDFPMVDFFVNGRIRQTRIFIKAEHLNSLFGKNNYFSAPETPYRDFMVRFGIQWNFFQ